MRATQAVCALAALILVWQGVVHFLAPPRYLLPSPQAVAGVFLQQPEFLLRHGLITATEILFGLAAGSLMGFTTALLLAALPRVGQFVWPVVLVLQALPVFVLAPVLVLWFGFGLSSKVVMTVIIIFFPVASAFADGLNRTDPDILDAASLTPASHWQILAHIRLPLALPSLISGLRVAAPLAPLGAVVGEWVGAAGGLGFIMIQANARMQADQLFAAMLILALFSVLLRLLVDRLTAGLAPWAREQAPRVISHPERFSTS
ncbi:ABC transporter permease [Rhizobium sp. SSA_523]|uniref:ABC transporter permease n=1 Tax=Rhizobium sp. SSA_523 TaxID=2952477 RepID=UPI00209085AC|nr:ABC transporter permease [Rhizobium sp. SSA_523]MCO5731430.1 ABC transporter permease [Rhizobium sp. SSA_523]WKC22048.1 ABC transporter permease [Rhizobium sp. SSA_523]